MGTKREKQKCSGHGRAGENITQLTATKLARKIIEHCLELPDRHGVKLRRRHRKAVKALCDGPTLD